MKAASGPQRDVRTGGQEIPGSNGRCGAARALLSRAHMTELYDIGGLLVFGLLLLLCPDSSRGPR
jgi:hypothetical protein